MEKFMYVSPYIRITQGYMIGSHKSSYAIDEGGSDSGKDYIIAPYSGVVKEIYSQYENEVFFESDNKIQFADGTIDHATTMFAHQDSPMAYGMKIGKHYNQGDKIYIEGGRYSGKNAHFAPHLHVEFAKGKYQGWYKNNSGYYSLPNAKKPEDCCFIDDSYKILNTNGIKFKNIKDVKADQILYKGSKVKFNGIFKVDIVNIKINCFGNLALTGCSLDDYKKEKVKPYHWIPSEPFIEVDRNGNKTKDQILSGGNSYVKNDNIYTVKDIDISSNSAKLNINGRNVWVFSKYLYEINDK